MNKNPEEIIGYEVVFQCIDELGDGWNKLTSTKVIDFEIPENKTLTSLGLLSFEHAQVVAWVFIAKNKHINRSEPLLKIIAYKISGSTPPVALIMQKEICVNFEKISGEVDSINYRREEFLKDML